MARSPGDEDRKHKHKDKKHKDKDRTKDRERKGKEERRGKERDRDSRRDEPVPAATRSPERGSGRDAAEELPLPPPPAQPEAVPEAAPVVNESGGEISMSIEETNKLRISLGLKPLESGPSKSTVPKEVAEGRARRAEEEKAAKAQELAERVATARERRKQQEALRATRTLGEASDEEEDLSAWVNKSRALEEQAKAAARAKAAALERQLAQQEEEEEEEDSDEEGGGGRYSARDLAGLKVKAGVEAMGVGESVVMTLADRALLDEKGQLDEGEDVLEDVLMREDKARDKARKAAGKAKPLFGEDGVARPMLDKYDEPEEEEAMELDEAGRLDEKQKRQEEIRKKLLHGNAISENAEVLRQAAADYYTSEEAAALFKPKKRKKVKKALRKREPGGDLAELEAAPAAAGGDAGDRGTRADREARAAQKADETAARSVEQRKRFDAALQAANYASLALKAESEAARASEAGGEEDDELYASLSRARAAAAKGAGSSAALVNGIASKRRAEEEAKAVAQARAAGGLEFNDASEFVRSIQVTGLEERPAPAQAAAGAEAEDEGVGMDVDDEAAAAAAPTAAAAEDRAAAGGKGNGMWGSWVPAEAAAQAAAAKVEEEEAREDAAAGPSSSSGGRMQELAVTREQHTAKGMAGTLALLRERGDLKEGLGSITWAGRTNDMKQKALVGLDEVYKGAAATALFEREVETALTRRDEYGRVMTPKESFRRLCHDFHGIYPSKNKKDKWIKDATEEIAKKRQATSDGLDKGSAGAMQKVQETMAAPYIVLSGQLKPGQISDATSGYATVERSESRGMATPSLAGRATPSLAATGRATPLVGDKKVEAMLGLRKSKGSRDMPPPPPKRPRPS